MIRAVTTAALLLICKLAASQPSVFIPPPTLAQPEEGGVRITGYGLVGNWYPGTGSLRRAAILVLGGSEGGIGPGAARWATDLVRHGYAVLQLAYFGAPGLPPQLQMVPLEYFDRALAWLRRQPSVDPRRIGIVGASKGAEAALLVAARNADVRAIVVGSPSAAVWPGITARGAPPLSSWSLHGRPVPSLPFDPSATTLLGGYQSGLGMLPNHPEAAIPAAHIEAHVLLVCGRADTLWPSCSMAQIVAAHMDGRARVLAYENAGHAVFGPPLPPDAPALSSLAALGGSAEGNNAGRMDAWPRVLGFLAERLDGH